MTEQSHFFPPVVAIATVALLVAFTLATVALFPARPDVSAAVSLEAAFAAILLSVIVAASRLDLGRHVGWPLFVGLVLFSLHSLAEVIGEFVRLPFVYSVALEEVTILAGTLFFLLGLYRWSHERTRRERLLDERRRRLEEMNDQLEVLTRIMRHDVKNETTVALGWAEILDQHVHDEEGRRAFDRVVDACQNIVAITDTAYDLVRILAADDEEQLRTEATDVRAVLDDEIRKARNRHDDASLTVEYGAGLTGTMVVANDLLGSVFANLLTNAVVHNDRDEPQVAVEVEHDGSRVRVRVADDGPGIPDDQKKEIFRKGEHGLESAGTGIGLFLVLELVNRYGGAIHVADNEPRGAVFVVDLPVAFDA
jgi:signal transduction histidine kinase